MVDGQPKTAGRKRRLAKAAEDADQATAPTEHVVPYRPTKPAKAVAKVMLYTHPKVARKFKEIALNEDRKANDVYLDALDLYLSKTGHRGIRQVIDS